jgi:poly(ADP-ribose) glycohydrolase
VLTNGCLQEEIKFITHPELLLSKLFAGPMRDNEAIIVTGALQYIRHSGYADNFECDGEADPRSSAGMPVIAIDALDFSKRNPQDQFWKENIDREWKKAYAGFSGVDSNLDTIATGNWGGGSFKVRIRKMRWKITKLVYLLIFILMRQKMVIIMSNDGFSPTLS